MWLPIMPKTLKSIFSDSVSFLCSESITSTSFWMFMSHKYQAQHLQNCPGHPCTRFSSSRLPTPEKQKSLMIFLSLSLGFTFSHEMFGFNLLIIS